MSGIVLFLRTKNRLKGLCPEAAQHSSQAQCGIAGLLPAGFAGKFPGKFPSSDISNIDDLSIHCL